ncbi:MAG TPA: glycosyltransferase family 4 protein [Solirubrobacter sp.]|nr:glycosyltransferase family 4 protein [Solirubrobacter sp.]
MKVALVTSIPHGGPIEHAVLLARELAALGVDVRTVVRDRPLAERFPRAAVIPLRHQLDAINATRVHRYVSDVDIIHSHDRRAGLWMRTVPTRPARVHTLHGLPDPYLGDPGLLARLAYGQFERRLRADLLLAPSHAAARALRELVGYTQPIEVVPNGVDVPDEPLPRGELVGTLSAHEPVKGLDVFLDAVPRVLEHRPETRFAIYGTGSLEAQLRERARGLPVTFPGHVPAEQALRELAVMALPSHMETSGIALLQAMAHGIPAVATRVGGIEETAPEGAASLIPPRDPEALAAAILDLLDDRDFAQARIRAGRAAAFERTARRTAERTLSLYESVMRAPRSRETVNRASV